MTGILVSKSRYQNSKTLSLSPSLENRAAKVFQQRSWLNDLSLPLLLMLAGSLASRPAHAQQETPLNDIAVNAQNQFGTASQLLIKDGVLYLIEDGCNLVMIRKLSDEDIAAIRALSTLSADEVGLHLQLVSYAPITVSELSEFCVASDPVSAFVNRIREDDGDSSSIAGFLAGGLGLLLALAGGGGGGSGRANLAGINISSDPKIKIATLDNEPATANDTPNVLILAEGNHGSEGKDIATGIKVTITNSDGSAVPVADISLSEGNDNEDDNLFILKKGQIYIKEGAPEKDKTKFDFESKPSFELIISGGGQKQILKVEITDKVLKEGEDISLSLAKSERDGDEAFSPIKIIDAGQKAGDLTDYHFSIVSPKIDKFKLTETKQGEKVTARHLELKDGVTLKDDTQDITVYVAANKFEILLAADYLKDTTIKSIAETSRGTFPQFTLTNSLTLDPIEVEVGTDTFIVLKTDGTFAAVTQSEVDALAKGTFAIVAKLRTDTDDIKDEGLIESQQATEKEKDYFRSTTELMKIDIELTDEALNLIVTKEMDDSAPTKGANDILGHDDEDDHVSYQEAEQAETANVRTVDLDGDTSDASDQIKSVDGVVIDLSATATDTQDTPVKYAIEANGVITLGANAGNLAAGDKLTSIENVTGSGFNDVLIGDDEANRLAGGDGDDYLIGGDDILDGGAGADTLDGGADSVRDTLTGGAGNDIFVASADDGSVLAGADLVTDFASGDKIQISLSQDDINTIKGEANAADKLDKLLELANLEVTNNADAGHSTTDKPDNDTVLTNKGANKALGGDDDTVLMILEDYSTDLTFDDFALDVL